MPKVGRPLTLGAMNEQLKKFLIVLRKKSGAVNRVVPVAAAKALISRKDDGSL